MPVCVPSQRRKRHNEDACHCGPVSASYVPTSWSWQPRSGTRRQLNRSFARVFALMIGKLIDWAVNNRVVVFLLTAALAAIGGYGFLNINVEAYPDPAPAIVEIATQYPGASAEEVERQVTIPIEVALAGMPGLKEVRSKSLFGLSYVSNQFEYGVDFSRA